MDEKYALEQLTQQTRDHAKRLAEEVARGASTPRLAVQRLMEYGRGVIDAVVLIYNSPQAMDAFGRVLDEEMERLDPGWSECEREDRVGRPIDVGIRD